MAAQRKDLSGLNANELESYGKLMARIKKDLEIKNELQAKGNALTEKEAERLEEINGYLRENRENYKKLVEKIKEANKASEEQADSILSIGKNLKDMGPMYKPFADQLKGSMDISNKIFESIVDIKDEFTSDIGSNFVKMANESLTDLIDISKLSREDREESLAKQTALQGQISAMKQLIPALQTSTELSTEQKLELFKMISALEGLIPVADKFSNISEETKEIYGEIQGDIKNIGNIFRKVGAYAEIFMQGWQQKVGLVAIGIGEIFEEFVEVNDEIGGAVWEMTAFKTQAFAISKILGEEAGKAVISLGSKLGDVRELSSGLAFDTGFIAKNMGLSGDEAAGLINTFGNLQGLSSETALNTYAATKELAMQNGVAPKQVMQDIARSAETVALFSKDGGKNIATAAIEAARLGSNLNTAGKMSDNLLDYNNSVAKEMEASVLLGRDLNLGKARELAYAGDIAGAQKEALQAAGGIEEFNKMDYFQKKAVAEALGVQVDELQQMSANLQRASTPAGILEGTFSSMKEGVEAITNTWGGQLLKLLGGGLMLMGDFGKELKGVREGFGIVKDTVGAVTGSLKDGQGFFKSMGNGLKALVGGKKPDIPGSAATPPANTPGNGPAEAMKSGSKINMNDAIKGAAAMLIMAAAVFVLGKALQEFNTVDWASLGKAGVALVGLGLAMFGLTTLLAPLAESGVLFLVAGGFLAFGASLYLVGAGTALFAQGVSSLSITMSGIGETLETLVAVIPQIFMLALAFSALAGALALLSVAGLSALPILAGLAIGGGFLMNLVGGGGGGASNNQDKLLEEIVGLRQDMNDGKIAVYLDGKKMNIGLAISNKRQPS